MIAIINKVGVNRPDPDNGKTYKRKLVIRENVKKYLNYSGSAGNEMIDDAIKLAEEKYNFISIKNNEEII